MNYFRNRFRRKNSSNTTSSSSSSSSTFSNTFNTESVLRDVRRRRNEALQTIDILSDIHEKRIEESHNATNSASNTIGRSSFKLKSYGGETSNHNIRTPYKSPKEEKAWRKKVYNDSDQKENSISLKSLNELNKDEFTIEIKKDKISQPHEEKSSKLSKDESTSMIRKTSSLRRRRHSSTSSDVKPTKKGNFISKKKEQPINQNDNDEESKLLNAIEIKSAAQWKAASKIISFKEDLDEDFNKSINFTTNIEKQSQFAEGFQPTKVQQLRLICWRIKPWKVSKNNRLFSSKFALGWGADCDEVYPNLFVGDKEAASNIKFLNKLGITHVLNTAEGTEEGLVNLNQSHYDESVSKINYLGFPLWDTPTCNILSYLGCASEFISMAIDNGGKCLVNCQMGVSRSSTCALAYLMIQKEMNACEALTQFRQYRDVRPNDGFLDQLVLLDNDLRQQRELGMNAKIKLSKIEDHSLLPNPWNYEFWTKNVTEDEIGMPLVKLGEPCPVTKKRSQSPGSSRLSPQLISRRSSNKSLASRYSSVSRHSSFKRICINRESSTGSSINDDEGDDVNWEWTWEEDNNELIDKENQNPESLTAEKLEKVKNIIEKPEERWRILWRKNRNCDTPSSISSSIKSNKSCLSNTSIHSNKIQPGLESNDPLSTVKVTSAKDWKTISKHLTINLEGIELDEENPNPAISVSLANDEEHNSRTSTPIEFIPTTVQQLRLICWRIKPWEQPRARHLYSSILASGWGVDCDEVFPDLFIGDEAAAKNIRFLNKMGITHVLNVAEGVWTDCSFVNITKDHYNNTGITYQGIQLWDSSKVRILPYFGCFNEFIQSALSKGGRCLVNCQMGVSRSCTAAMAYMMLTVGWDAVDTMREFRKRRDVRPNDHFLAQIAELDNDLRKYRLFGLPRRIELHTLDDLNDLPKPWHFEFWDTLPEEEVLPFKLSHMSENFLSTKESLEVGDDTNTEIISNTSTNFNSDDEWEWEYYDDNEDKKEKEISEPIKSQSNLLLHQVNSARDWREISVKVKDICYDDNEESTLIPTLKSDNKKDCFVPTLEKNLRLICWRVKPWKEKSSAKLFSSKFAIVWKVDCDEVFPNLFIGDQAAAKNIKFLNHLKITNVLNTAEGQDENLVDLNEEYFVDSNINYKGFLMWDSTWFDVSPFIDEAVEFIDKALQSGEKCLVNCQMGVSRSSTCAISYMMIKLGYTASDALRLFRQHRDVRPNDGFLKYLADLDNKLRRNRELL